MYDITFAELIVGYLVFSSMHILLWVLYFRYRRTGTIPKEPHELFSEEQKVFLKEFGVEVSCMVFEKIATMLLNTPTTLQAAPVTQPSNEPMTEDEVLSESFLPIDYAGQEIDSGQSVYYDEISNLADVMQGEQVSHRNQMDAYHTVGKIATTDFFEQMISNIEEAKQNLTTVFSTIASKYNDPTSVNPYKVYENVDFLPVKRKQTSHKEK